LLPPNATLAADPVSLKERTCASIKLGRCHLCDLSELLFDQRMDPMEIQPEPFQHGKEAGKLHNYDQVLKAIHYSTNFGQHRWLFRSHHSLLPE